MPPVSHIDLLTPLLADTPDLSVLGDPASWGAIKQHAGRYGVAGLIAYAVRPHVSKQERVWCDRILTESWVRHERMLRRLEFLIGLFADANVPVISLKGPLLAQRWYEPAFLRKPSIDLDFAVSLRDLDAACGILAAAGYTSLLPVAQALVVSHHVTFTHPSNGAVELHFRLSHQSLGISVDQFFDRTETRRVPSGLDARVLGPADQLLHLILHLAQSRFGTLFHLYEIRRIFRAESPAVRSEAIQRALDHHFCGAIRMTDVACRAVLGEPLLPPELPVPETWLNWRLNEKLYRAFERWGVPDRELTLGARLWGRWLEFQITDSPSDALRFMSLFFNTARVQMSRGAWGKVKDLAYTPYHTAR